MIAQCSRGWSARCAASKGTRCKCACGGHNHGGLRKNEGDQSLECTPDGVFSYGWDEARPPRPQLLVPDDRIIECVRLTQPGPWGDIETGRVYLLDGEYREQLPRRYVKHSPTGFEWGYGGSGPADLALNILALVVSPKEAWRFHQDFKFARVALIPHDGGRIPLSDVRCWLEQAYDHDKNRAAAAR